MRNAWKSSFGLFAAVVWSVALAQAAERVSVHPLGEAGSQPGAGIRPGSAEQGANGNDVCRPDYRHKVLVTAFPVQSPVQLSDQPRLPQMLQMEIARRLEQSGHVLMQISNGEAAYPIQPGQFESQWNPEWIRDLARRHGVQFVVGGILRDAGFEGERYALSYGNDMRAGERKQAFDIPLLRFFKPGIKATPAARRFEMELQVFDGISGIRLGQHRLAGRAEGEVVLPATVDTDSQRFFASDFGRLVSARVDEAVKGITTDLRCQPLMARVIRIEAGRVYLDAGSSSGLVAGARAEVRHLLPGMVPLMSSSRVSLGVPTEAVGTLVIRQAEPLFAIAEKEGVFPLDVGDPIRAGGAE